MPPRLTGLRCPSLRGLDGLIEELAGIGN